MKISNWISNFISDFSKWYSRFYWCTIWGLHDWTAKIDKDPDKEIDDFDDFIDHVRTYCARCNKTSVFSIEFENEVKFNRLKNEKRDQSTS